MSKITELLNWRYATKKYDSSKAVPAEKLERILEAVRLTATSSGLQPFELLVVTNPQVREKIKAVSWDQAQIPTALIYWCSPLGTTSRLSVST